MSREFLSSVVHALRFSAFESGDGAGCKRERRDLSGFSASEWSRHIGVLDRVGLALPLYARLLEDGKCSGLPLQALAALEQRRCDNKQRMSAMFRPSGRQSRRCGRLFCSNPSGINDLPVDCKRSRYARGRMSSIPSARRSEMLASVSLASKPPKTRPSSVVAMKLKK